MAQEVAHKDLHRVVMTCFVHDQESRFLVMRRSEDARVHPGKWGVPGGGLEQSDYIDKPQSVGSAWVSVLDEALRREVQEEVNVLVGELTYLGNAVFVRPDGVPVLLLRFMAPYESGDVTLEEGKFTEHAWVSVDDLDQYDLLGDVAQELREAAKHR